MPNPFRSGTRIPASGIYRVIHKRHRLPHEVTLLRGEVFPVCSKCQDAVVFSPVQLVDDDRMKHNIVLHQLPELDKAA